MRQCPACSTPAQPTARFCSTCGSSFERASRMATAIAPPPLSAITPSSAAVVFSPGEIVAERYRIAGLLGRGGMGEVYRADDLKLGQAVALKFLPRALERDPNARERFHAEVRLARQVSHPHVCRVYDIGEVEGRPFLSMEYVDGEDLASLLRRIGRLPPTKAVEIARQLCAGLAAAHEKGVLHRDLKPANVMVDGHGRARITDFGLAVGHEDTAGGFAGTPAYMAPERLAGGPATVRSDLFELGLVLYELFTGKHAFEEQRPASRPLTHPSMITADIEPAAERAILRCLEAQPERRPRSAAEIALALPGGDPLAAAVAAGETPSPEMVAAAGGEGVLARGRAWALLLGVLALVAVLGVLGPASSDLGLAPMDRGPEVLRHRARELAERWGGPQAGGDSAAWLERNYDVIRWLADNLPSTEWRHRLASIGPPVMLHLRHSPHPLVTADPGARVDDEDPAPTEPGMIHVAVDGRGRLARLDVVPPRWEPAAAPEGDLSWEGIVRETALDPARLTEVEPTWVPPVPFDARREWTGTVEELPELPLRLSVAAQRGRFVHVVVLGPWDAPTAVDPLERGISPKVRGVTLAWMIVALVFFVPFIARRNLRQGRGDRRGAARVAGATGAFGLLAWLGAAHLPADPAIVAQLGGALALGAAAGVFAWLGYLALEPYLRRQTPELFIGWARVLEGRFNDPRVGRDVLWGVLLGATGSVAVILVNAIPTWFPFARQTTMPPLVSLGAGMSPLAALLQVPIASLVRALSLVCLAFLLRLIVKRRWAVFVCLWLVGVLLAWGAENVPLEAPGAIIMGLVMAIAVTRFGLLATAAFTAATLLLISFPLVLSSGWYAPYALLATGLLVGIAAWAFRVSLGGQPVFGGSLDA